MGPSAKLTFWLRKDEPNGVLRRSVKAVKLTEHNNLQGKKIDDGFNEKWNGKTVDSSFGRKLTVAAEQITELQTSLVAGCGHRVD